MNARNDRYPVRRGFFLVLVLVVIAMATMAAYSFTDLMIAYDEGAYLKMNRGQAQMLVDSGIDASRLILSQPRATRESSGGVFSNPQLFQAVNVVPGLDASERGNFTILAPALDETGQMSGLRYGLQNESARLNLNVLPTLDASGEALMSVTSALAGDAVDTEGIAADSLARSLLMGLPNMSVEIADAILDFIDEDDEPREFGAESEHYLSLPNPYSPKNGPLDSVEELLLVRGVSPWMMFGADANRNGVIDAAEQQASLSSGTGTIALGWSSYLTVYSLENNKRSDGTPRINVNGDDLEALYDQLSEALGNDEWATFIVAYRIAGNPPANAMPLGAGMPAGDAGGSGGSGDGPGGGSSAPAATGFSPSPGGGQSGDSGGGSGGGPNGDSGGGPPQPWSADVLDSMDLSGGAKTQLSQLLDLVGATVTVNDQTYESPFLDGPLAFAIYMPALMGNLTTLEYSSMPGRINLNECPAELIRGIPLIDPEVAEAIVEARGQSSDTENRQFETWPLVEGIVTLEEMKLLMPLVTSGGDVYRAQIVGYFEGRNASSRSEVVIDATTVNPKVIYWRDLSHLGRGFDVSVLGVRAADAVEATLRSASN